MSTTVSAADKPIRRFPPPCWTQDEALALIQAYRDRWYALCRGYLRTADWDAVAEDVGRIRPGAIPPKTSAQSRHKMEKLRQRYRAEKQREMSFDGGQFISTWFYFEAMDSMEKNGNGSNSGKDTQSGMKIVNSKINHQSGMNIDSGYGGLNPGRGIRFKTGSVDNNLVTVASRSNNYRVSHSYAVQKEDNDNDNDNVDEYEDDYYVETLNNNKILSKNPKLLSQNYQDFEQHLGVRPRKFSKTGSYLNNSNHSYLNANGFSERNVRNFDGESEKRGVKRENDSIGEISSSIKLLADGFVKMEKMKMDMVRDIEKMRMEAEMKRTEMLLESQKQIVEAFVKGFTVNKKLG